MQEKIEHPHLILCAHCVHTCIILRALHKCSHASARLGHIPLLAGVHNDQSCLFGQVLAHSPAFGALLALRHCLFASPWKEFASIFRRGRQSDGTTLMCMAALANSPEQVNLQQKQQSNRCCQRSPYVPSANFHCETGVLGYASEWLLVVITGSLLRLSFGVYARGDFGSFLP